MSFFLDFLHQKAPRLGKEMPSYYKKAMTISEQLLAVYFVLFFGLDGLVRRNLEQMPLFMFAAVLVCLAMIGKMNVRVCLGSFALIICIWCGWYTYTFGWASSSQLFLLTLLVLVFFNINDPPWLKLLCFLALIGFRMLMFAYSLRHPPVIGLGQTADIMFQTLNSLTVYVMLMFICILFSTSIQDTERQLRLDNQELHKEAGTDPLTQLPNRRAMMDIIDLHRRSMPDETFSIAIGDIDFFKKVNDTYGHHCGDYTLRALSDRFRELAGADFRVCRWGGEEFCFFMPGMNIDQAGAKMVDVCIEVRRLKLSFEENDFNITITIGVAENDFTSTVHQIIEEADHKLYMGKEAGRNRVVM